MIVTEVYHDRLIGVVLSPVGPRFLLECSIDHTVIKDAGKADWLPGDRQSSALIRMTNPSHHNFIDPHVPNFSRLA